MQISSRFTIAIHIFACIDTFEKDYKITSDFLANSVNVNPVVIRRLLVQLKAAGLIAVQRGSGGASIAKPLEEITFLDIYRAVEGEKPLLHLDIDTNPECGVGIHVQLAIGDFYREIQDAAEQKMAAITLQDIIDRYHAKLENVYNTNQIKNEKEGNSCETEEKNRTSR